MEETNKDVLVIVDMLKGFYTIGNLANPRMANIIPNVVDLIRDETWAAIFVVGDQHKKDDKEFKMYPEHCVEGTEETELVDEIRAVIWSRPTPFYSVKKTRFSALYDTVILPMLSFYNNTEYQFTVVGVCTDICILHTVADLRMRDYRVTVPKNCIETFDGPNHNADEWNRFALAHMQYTLGTKVI